MVGLLNRSPLLILLTAFALIAVAATSVLSLPIIFFIGLTFICALLSPVTPLAMLVVLLTLSPLRTLIATESTIALPLDIGQILLVLYLGIWLADRIRQRKPVFAFQPSMPMTAAICLTAVFTLGAWTGASFSGWLTEWLKWVVMTLLIWNLPLMAGKHWRWLIFAILLSAAANALVGLYIFLGGSGADHLLILGRFFRAFGTFGQPNPFGGFMGIALPIAIMAAYSQLPIILSGWQTNRRLPWGPALVFALCTLASLLILSALVASWSRGAWLGTAIAILAMLVALPRQLIRGVFLTIGIAFFFTLMWATGLLPSSIVSRLTTTATELVTISDVRGVAIYPSNYAVIERLAHWQAAINMAADSPLLGVGLGSYEVVYDNYRLINWEEPLGHAHNLYLNMLAETGIVGLAAYLAFWLAILRLTWSLRRHPDDFSRCVVIGLLGSWVYIAVHSIFDNLYVNNLFLHIGVLLSVLAVLQLQLTQALELE